MLRADEVVVQPLALLARVVHGLAGVIGEKKFAYDLWGDTVNTASRMESNGEADRIHISADTRELLGDDYVVEPRGEMEIKGKGPMETFFLVAKS